MAPSAATFVAPLLRCLCMLVCIHRCFHCYASNRGKSAALPVEAVNMLLFLRMYQRVAKLSKGVLERVIPSYIYDSISIV